ncbi:MAG: formate dehydrogenase subunit gamma [Gammaproteobacteria bacterium]|nr:formate dehydrogenase subunit gamma [Gammaproteobacteria bacterium]MDH5800399.1 formate dehydrogenase subunit gamma [Gammaproteobacteria bacterium]
MHTMSEVNRTPDKGIRRKGLSRRVIRNTFLVMMCLAILPLIPYAIEAVTEGVTNPNPGAQLWRDIRQRDGAVEGQTQIQGIERGVLISTQGEEWRQYRSDTLVPYSSIIFSAIILAFVVYYLVVGQIKIQGSKTGSTIQRTTKAERYVHWFAAGLFVILALTGLILLYGRWVLIPILGPEGFAVTATLCKLLHNYLGPVFIIAVILLFLYFVKDSVFNMKVDGAWFAKAGGYLGGEHPSSGKFNAGQKAWFWVAVLGGLVLSGSGLVLDFPNFEQGRVLMQDAHWVHSISAVVVIGFFFVHVYLASVGVEGALDAMVSGEVDSNWVKQHHDLWYEQVKDQAKTPPT